ncbi:MAG: terminase gpA endonuclease subunit, partial [Actinomycetota bacterium]
FCEHCGVGWAEADRVRAVTTRGGVRHYQTKAFTCCDERQEPMQTRAWEWDEETQCGYATCTSCGARGLTNRHASFTASKLYSPFTSVVELVYKWMDSKDDPEQKQTFYNTQLGQPFRADVSKEINFHWLASRREQYHAQVPDGVLVLTAGVDVQPGGTTSTGRLEVEVVGWGIGEESWSVDTHVIHGDPAQPEVWQELDDYLLQPWHHRRGFDMYVSAACLDSGGHNVQEVYNFSRARYGRNVWAIKGASDRGGQWTPVWPAAAQEQKHKKYRVGFKPVVIGVNAAKEAIRQRLLIEEPGPGYCHFPIGRPEGWFDQLTSENLVIERKAGQSVRKWVLQKGRANEALDCRVYAYAALVGMYHTRRLRLERQAEILERRTPEGGPRGGAAEDPAPRAKPKRKKSHRSPWMDG